MKISPFRHKSKAFNWFLLLILGATIAYVWTHMLDSVVEEGEHRIS